MKLPFDFSQNMFFCCLLFEYISYLQIEATWHTVVNSLSAVLSWVLNAADWRECHKYGDAIWPSTLEAAGTAGWAEDDNKTIAQ